MRHPLPEQRIVRGALDATISHQFYDSDGDPADPTTGGATVTVAVTRSDGTSVTVGSVTGSGTSARTVTVGVAELGTIDRLTAVWSLDATAVATDVVEVVGGTVGSVTAIKAGQTSLASKSADVVKTARQAAEDRFVSKFNRSPFERLHVQRFDGTGCAHLFGAHFPDLVEVRWARIYTSATAYTSLTAAQLAAINTPDQHARFERLDGNTWPDGCQNIEVGYVFGMTSVPGDLRDAFYRAVRVEVNKLTQGIPDRTTTWVSAEGMTFGQDKPGRAKAYGIAEIDDVWFEYRDPRPLVA